MTFLGKVLVVVQLVLSVMFMAFAGAVFTAQKNWRDDATKSKQSLVAAQSKATAGRTAMQSQIDTIQKDLTALKNDKVTLEGQVKTLTDENARLDSDNKSMKDHHQHDHAERRRGPDDDPLLFAWVERRPPVLQLVH